MLNKYKGCLIGAILGDALGMADETTTARFLTTPAFGRAYKGHPNHNLLPGQYTDDGQLILIASRLLAGNVWDKKEYAKELLRTYTLDKFRYPDGATYAACKNMEKNGNLTESGINSDSAGCMGLAIPFALAFKDRKEMAKELLSACSITQTHPGVHAAAIGFALLLNTLLETSDVNKAFDAMKTAAENMDPLLAQKIDTAIKIEHTGMPVGAAVSRIGNSSSVYQTLPLAVFFCKRYYVPRELLGISSTCGGNADTISLLCGAFSGARFGISALPEDLIPSLERVGIFLELAEKLLNRGSKTQVPESGE
ncbi:MAG: ADP-ribosylglycohydrolase family protein [Methanocorpusculum sp.]|jgi:ADP-ribosylglycohydrolase|nr:ADP-ribosylglycohydrolase family protein [Methanocorpusculum sp.]MDD2470914.1 ADP-ribosylglycohydrolase family protein [Methanocorpusculum sp.]MDD3256675.1 ADP-ribosylglycohydrolase family protein [Methanocorpusculum sp.]